MFLRLDCFSRGLLREALGQLAGLKRRKLALEMLGAAIQNGLDQQNAAQEGGTNVSGSSSGGSQKRKLEADTNQSDQEPKQQEETSEVAEPTAKKMRVETVQ